MSKVTCKVCNREIDSRGLSGHMKTHTSPPKGNKLRAQGVPDTEKSSAHPKNSDVKEAKKVQDNGTGDNGVISYPSNEQEIENVESGEEEKVLDEKKVLGEKKKPVKKPVASHTTSNSTNSPNAGEHDKPVDKVKDKPVEYQGLFR